MIFWIFFLLILSVIVEVYLWWKWQASLIFLSGRTCTIGGWLNTFLPHCFLQHLHKVLCRCSGIDLHFLHQSTFISRRQNMSPYWAVWQLHGPMVFILVYYCLYRWTWYLLPFVNCSQGWTRLAEVYNSFSEVLADFFWFSHDVKQRGTVFEGRPWNPQVHLQLTEMMSISLSEASKAMTSFSGIVQA